MPVFLPQSPTRPNRIEIIDPDFRPHDPPLFLPPGGRPPIQIQPPFDSLPWMIPVSKFPAFDPSNPRDTGINTPTTITPRGMNPINSAYMDPFW